jgi:hypothetical protein
MHPKMNAGSRYRSLGFTISRFILLSGRLLLQIGKKRQCSAYLPLLFYAGNYHQLLARTVKALPRSSLTR